jgi:hypothetical protein
MSHDPDGDGVLVRMRALLAGVTPGRDKVALIVSNGHGNVLLTHCLTRGTTLTFIRMLADEQARLDGEGWP